MSCSAITSAMLDHLGNVNWQVVGDGRAIDATPPLGVMFFVLPAVKTLLRKPKHGPNVAGGGMPRFLRRHFVARGIFRLPGDPNASIRVFSSLQPNALAPNHDRSEAIRS
jgi:hypothetical protein